MSYYSRNRACSCTRCRARGLTGPVIIITVGVLFLLQQFDIVQFGKSWPVLLLVIGGFSLFCNMASSEDHQQWTAAPVPPPSTVASVPPPPMPAANPNGPEVKS